MKNYLDFEKPIAELEGKIEELRHLSGDGDFNIADEVSKLQVKAERLLRQTYQKLTAWQKVQVARHPDRPHFKDYVAGLIEDFTPIAGDRCFADDKAILCGIGRFRGYSCVVIGQEKGADTSVACRIGDEPPRYALEGSIAIAGALVQWLRDNLRLVAKSSEIEALAREVDDNGDVYFVPASSGLFAPYWRDDARGAIVGLTRYANRGHIARAALEATAYQTRDVLDAMRADTAAHVNVDELRVDGGMVANELLMQFQADVLGVPVVRPRITETTALGAAYAAGLAVGYWPDEQALKRNWGVAKRWEPAMAEAERERLYAKWRKAVTRSFDWA
jgi:glycerol kinase